MTALVEHHTPNNATRSENATADKAASVDSSEKSADNKNVDSDQQRVEQAESSDLKSTADSKTNTVQSDQAPRDEKRADAKPAVEDRKQRSPSGSRDQTRRASPPVGNWRKEDAKLHDRQRDSSSSDKRYNDHKYQRDYRQYSQNMDSRSSHSSSYRYDARKRDREYEYTRDDEREAKRRRTPTGEGRRSSERYMYDRRRSKSPAQYSAPIDKHYRDDRYRTDLRPYDHRPYKDPVPSVRAQSPYGRSSYRSGSYERRSSRSYDYGAPSKREYSPMGRSSRYGTSATSTTTTTSSAYDDRHRKYNDYYADARSSSTSYPSKPVPSDYRTKDYRAYDDRKYRTDAAYPSSSYGHHSSNYPPVSSYDSREGYDSHRYPSSRYPADARHYEKRASPYSESNRSRYSASATTSGQQSSVATSSATNNGATTTNQQQQQQTQNYSLVAPQASTAIETQQPPKRALPPNWDEYFTPEGKAYYHNRLTNTTQWNFPTE